MKKQPGLYLFIEKMVWVFFPKMTVEGKENLPDEPAIIVGNHSHASGPIVGQIYYPRYGYCWCISQMMECKEVPDYAYVDFWSKKPKWSKWLFRLISYIIAPIGSYTLKNAKTIPVYKDKRVMTTFKLSMDMLDEGADVIIFPEHEVPYNNIVYEFQRGFVDVAALYAKRKKKALPFVPMYVCPSLKKVVFGKPVYYNPEADRKAEEERICEYLQNEISELAYSLPVHTVVPYPNVSKKQYPKSVKVERS